MECNINAGPNSYSWEDVHVLVGTSLLITQWTWRTQLICVIRLASTTWQRCFDVAIQKMMWVIWKYMNRVCFDFKPPRKKPLFDEIKVLLVLLSPEQVLN